MNRSIILYLDGGTLFEAGDEGRDADACADPNWCVLVILEIEAVGNSLPYRHWYADLRRSPQAAGMVFSSALVMTGATICRVPGRGDV